MCVRRLAGQLLRQMRTSAVLCHARRLFPHLFFADPPSFSSSPLAVPASLLFWHMWFGSAWQRSLFLSFSRALKSSQVGNASVQSTAAHCQEAARGSRGSHPTTQQSIWPVPPPTHLTSPVWLLVFSKSFSSLCIVWPTSHAAPVTTGNSYVGF